MKPVCLTIAGSDSGAGAGIQADLKTFASLDCYAASVVTAVTAQNTLGVHDLVAMQSEMVTAQLNAVLSDMPVVAVKIGMLMNESIIRSVSKCLAEVKLPIVLDPVVTSSSGTALLDSKAIEALRTCLFPLCSLVTPNIQEAEKLTGAANITSDQTEALNLKMLKLGAKASLITGGDAAGKTKTDLLSFTSASHNISTMAYSHETISTRNTHGTGCTLSSAITAFLAKGFKLEHAVKTGIAYTNRLLQVSRQFNTGRGYGGLDHFALINTRKAYESLC